LAWLLLLLLIALRAEQASPSRVRLAEEPRALLLGLLLLLRLRLSEQASPGTGSESPGRRRLGRRSAEQTGFRLVVVRA
jgi:hypothetical protein